MVSFFLNQPPRRVKKRKLKTEARSAGEAFEKMLQEKKLSKKINYDVFKDLDLANFKTDSAIKIPAKPADNEECEVCVISDFFVTSPI